ADHDDRPAVTAVGPRPPQPRDESPTHRGESEEHRARGDGGGAAGRRSDEPARDGPGYPADGRRTSEPDQLDRPHGAGAGAIETEGRDRQHRDPGGDGGEQESG